MKGFGEKNHSNKVKLRKNQEIVKRDQLIQKALNLLEIY